MLGFDIGFERSNRRMGVDFVFSDALNLHNFLDDGVLFDEGFFYFCEDSFELMGDSNVFEDFKFPLLENLL